MRIKPKNPKMLKMRRTFLGVVAFAVVLVVLLYPQNDSGSAPDDESAGVPETAATPVPENMETGELEWEYWEGWVDYSDLPDKSELGDEETPGLSNWRYLVVNSLDTANYLSSKYYPPMEYVESGYSFRTDAVQDLKDFIAAARNEGYVVSMSRTYLSYQDQKVRFNGMASIIYDQGGCTLAEAEEQAMAEGWFPGADEHQTGMAVNFVDEDGNAKFSTPVLVWMTEHCAEYGFILRYPEGREIYTGHEAEAGHFRYVGQVAAEYIMRKGISLEEFKDAYDEEAREIWLW